MSFIRDMSLFKKDCCYQEKSVLYVKLTTGSIYEKNIQWGLLFRKSKKITVYLITFQFCFLELLFQCLLLGHNHDSFPRLVFLSYHMSFSIDIPFCHLPYVQNPIGSFSVLTNTYTMPETQRLEYLIASMKTVMDFGSKISLVAAIISSQYLLQ